MKWTYHTSHSYTIDGEQVSFMTQLYQTGVYGIVNGDASMQVSFTPAKLVKLEKKLLRQQKEGKITDLTFGREITVTDEPDGFYVEVET